MANQQDGIIPGTTAETAERLLEIVRSLLAEINPGQKETFTPVLDSSLDRDLGLDSLAQVELLARIERSFNISLWPQLIQSVIFCGQS
jgi:acyl carrier protein